MKTLICALVLLLPLGGVALAGQVLPTAPMTIATTPDLAEDSDAGAPPLGLGESLLTIIKVEVNVWLGIDLFGDSAETDGPQLDGGRGVGIQVAVPTRDSGSASADL
ncbi:MAG: hypothetical protein ABIJ61_11020 [bacterium]